MCEFFPLARLCLRLERVVIGTIEGKAKVLGTLMGIGGAMVLTFYKGFEVRMWSTHVDLLHQHGHQPRLANHHPAFSNHPEHGAHVLGSMLAIGNCVCYSLWLIIQVPFRTMRSCFKLWYRISITIPKWT